MGGVSAALVGRNREAKSRTRAARTAALLLLPVLAGACTGGKTVETFEVDNGDSIAMSADLRAILVAKKVPVVRLTPTVASDPVGIAIDDEPALPRDQQLRFRFDGYNEALEDKALAEKLDQESFTPPQVGGIQPPGTKQRPPSR